MVSGILPDVVRSQDDSEMLEFAWTTTPSFPSSFTYRVTVPEEESGQQEITGEALYRTTGEELRTGDLVTVISETEDKGTGSFGCASGSRNELTPNHSSESANSGDLLMMALISMALIAAGKRRIYIP